MVDELQVPPFIEWLLGPTWREGRLFQTLIPGEWGLAVLLVVLLVLLGLLVFAIRKGSTLAARLVVWVPIVAAIVAITTTGVVWLIDPDRQGFTNSERLMGWAESTLGPEWYLGSLWGFLAVAAGLGLTSVLVGTLVSVLYRGPIAGLRSAHRVLTEGVLDLFAISPRRVFALSWLAVKESIRRRVLVGFAVFIVLLLFAGWFLDPNSTNPARLYLSFVLTASSYLVLGLMLFLSVFSLPADLQSRTLHTVVTKPVRPSEIVLGRMLGFAVMGTGLLAVMCGISYIFVDRGLNHSHALADEDLVFMGRTAGGQGEIRTGQTEKNKKGGHFHDVTIHTTSKEEPWQGHAEMSRGHWHPIDVQESDGKKICTLGAPEGDLQARVPKYGKLHFRTRDGFDADKGISVGDEWAYRSFIAGGTQAAAIWTFDDITPERFVGDYLRAEMTLGVFRTYKGNIKKGIVGSLTVRNPHNGLAVQLKVFESKEFLTKQLEIPRKINRGHIDSVQILSRQSRKDGETVLDPLPNLVDKSLTEKAEYDLYDDLTHKGKMEIWLRCLEPKQYFGAAQADLYLRAADTSFRMNFIKGYFGIWLQMLLVIGFGVMFSTFLSGAVAMIATVGVLLGGFYGDFMQRLAIGETYGGGSFESTIRLFNQQNVMSDLNPGLGGETAKMLDIPTNHALNLMSRMLPRFGEFSHADYVAYGFNISWDLILVRSVSTAAFLLPVFVLAFFFLKTREVAR